MNYAAKYGDSVLSAFWWRLPSCLTANLASCNSQQTARKPPQVTSPGPRRAGVRIESSQTRNPAAYGNAGQINFLLIQPRQITEVPQIR